MKILIVMKNLIIGGVETSALNFIKNMHPHAEIDLLLLNKSGELFEQVPEYVNLVNVPESFSSFGTASSTNRVKLVKVIYGLLRKFGAANLNASVKIKKFKKQLKNFNFSKQYDLALSFNGFDYICNYLVLNKISAEIKACIIHNDVYKVCLPLILKKQFQCFDICFGCSKSCSEKFKTKYKMLNNVPTLYNFQNIERIKKGALEQTDVIKDKNVVSFLTISRLENRQKAYKRMLKVINKLQKEGYKFDYYWIGGGSEKDKEYLNSFIEKNKLTTFHFLDAQTNPFKFLKQTDFFVLPSRYEAAPMVYAESMTLGVPVLTTNTCSADELVGKFGWVCQNNAKGIYTALKFILDNPDEIDKKRKSLENYSWDNDSIKKIILHINSK